MHNHLRLSVCVLFCIVFVGCKEQSQKNVLPPPEDAAIETPVDEIAKATSILKALEKTLGPDRVELISELYGLAELHAANGQYEKVAAYYLQAARIGERSVQPKLARYDETLENLTRTYLQLERFAEASPFFDSWLELRRVEDQATSPKSFLYIMPVSEVANQYAKAGNYEFAAVYHQQVIVLLQPFLSDKHARYRYHHDLAERTARFFVKHQKSEIAKPLLRQLLKVSRDPKWIQRALDTLPEKD